MFLKKKGFLLTIDAFFALAVIAVAAYSFTAIQNQQGWGQKFPSLEGLGHDFLYLNASGVSVDESVFRELTGFNVSRTPPLLPNAEVVARAVAYRYPNACGCQKGVDCAPVSGDCAKRQDAEPANSTFEAWVTP